jgi:hypothetical protein
VPDSLKKRTNCLFNYLSTTSYFLQLPVNLLNRCRKQRAFRIGREGVAVFDFTDYPVKIDFAVRQNDDDIAGTVKFLVKRKFDDCRVAIFPCETASYSKLSAL